jgi:hypothetical protein
MGTQDRAILQVSMVEMLEIVGSEGIDLAWDGMLYVGPPEVRASELLRVAIRQVWDSKFCLECTSLGQSGAPLARTSG